MPESRLPLTSRPSALGPASRGRAHRSGCHYRSRPRKYRCQPGPPTSGRLCGRGRPDPALSSARPLAGADVPLTLASGLSGPRRHSQSVHEHCALGGLAACGGDCAPHQAGLRPDPAEPGGRALPRGAAHRPPSTVSVHPQVSRLAPYRRD